MTLYFRRFFFVPFLLCLLAACTKPVLIGSDLLEDEKANLQFTDQFDLSFFTEKTDSIIVHSDNLSLQLITYLCGHVDDPIFGTYSAAIYAQPILPTIATVLIGSMLDSVVLQLRYDTLGSYGDLSQPVTLEVYRMTENPGFKQNYYSNTTFMTSPQLLGSLTFVPRPKDSVTVIRPTDTIRVAPHVRIPISRVALGDILVQDSVVYQNQDSFLNFFNGLYIKMTGATNTMLGFNLLNSVSGLSFYYDKDPAMDLEFKFIFTSGSIKVVHMEHDYTGTIVESALTPEPEEDLWFIQGMAGVRTAMRLEGLDVLGNAIINQAELEVYCTFPDGDMGHLYPPPAFIVTQEKSDSVLLNSSDVTSALSLTAGNFRSSSYGILYGGVLGKPDPGPPVVFKYTMKVTRQLIDIHTGKKENVIYFNPFDKGDVPHRAVFFGPGHPTYAPRLKVYYTSI